VTLTLQASTKRWLAERLGLSEEPEPLVERSRVSPEPPA